ncbi:MAG: hypothetical protein GX845_05915 [Erysipelothrix sp.]|nr:hypothetical protein [Erysipelothrix sp.]
MNYDKHRGIITLVINMARVPRQTLKTNVFLIEQHSSDEIFTSNDDRNVFIDLLKQAQNQFLIDIYAYCLLDKHRFKLIVNTHKQSISKVMQSLIISYTAYRKCEGTLFPQRFKSTPLYNRDEVLAHIQAIHKQSNSIYNSFCVINNIIKHDLDWISDIKTQAITFKKQHQAPLSDEELKTLCQTIMDTYDCDFETLKQDKALRNQCIVRLRQESNCTLKQLGELFGGLSESTISKIIKNMGQAT